MERGRGRDRQNSGDRERRKRRFVIRSRSIDRGERKKRRAIEKMKQPQQPFLYQQSHKEKGGFTCLRCQRLSIANQGSCSCSWKKQDNDDTEVSDSPVFDIERSALYGHIQALKNAERVSFEDPKDPQILKRWGTASMGIASFVKDRYTKKMFLADAFKAVLQLSGLEPKDSPVFEPSRLYGHIQALKDAERESVEDPKNPKILKRCGTALLEIAKVVNDRDEQKMFLAGAMRKFDAVWSKKTDEEARVGYLSAYLRFTPRKGDDDLHYDVLREELTSSTSFLEEYMRVKETWYLEEEMRREETWDLEEEMRRKEELEEMMRRKATRELEEAKEEAIRRLHRKVVAMRGEKTDRWSFLGGEVRDPLEVLRRRD